MMVSSKAIDAYAGRLLMVSFFLPQKWQVISVMAAGVYFVYRSVATKQLIPKKDYALAATLGSLYFLYLLAIPLTGQPYLSWLLIICQRKVSLLLLPLMFARVGHHFRKVILGELDYFVYACFISALTANIFFAYHYLFLHDAGAGGLSHVAYRVMMEKLTGIHPTYMGMFLGFAMCILLYSPGFRYRHGSVVKYALFCVLSIFLLSLLVKSALIAMVIVLIHFGWVRRSRLRAYLWPLAGVAAAIGTACLFIPFIGQRVREVFAYFGTAKPGNVTDNSVYVRKMIFDVDAAMVKANWLTGVGPARVLHLLKDRYFFYSLLQQYDVSTYDPHNEYFYEWLSFGIAGIIVLASVLVLHFRRALVVRNYLYVYCLIILCITFFTETVLSRQEGVLFYALFTSLFFFAGKGSQEGSESGNSATVLPA